MGEKKRLLYLVKWLPCTDRWTLYSFLSLTFLVAALAFIVFHSIDSGAKYNERFPMVVTLGVYPNVP